MSKLIEWFGAGHPPGEMLYWISQIILAGVAIGAAFIAYRQVKAFGALELVKFMQSDSNRRARTHLRNQLENKPFAQWTDDDRFQASTVCSSFDLMGFLIKNKLSPQKAYIDLYATTIQRCHKTLTDYLIDMRDVTRNGKDFWRHFDWLNEQAKQIKPPTRR